MLDIKAVIFAKHKGVKFDEDHSEANFAKHDKTELRYSKLRQTEQKKRAERTLLRIAAAVFSLLLCIAPHPIGVYGEGAAAGSSGDGRAGGRRGRGGARRAGGKIRFAAAYAALPSRRTGVRRGGAPDLCGE